MSTDKWEHLGIKELPLAKLTVNHTYQRLFRPKQGEKLVQSFDPWMVDPLRVVPVNGHYEVVDGQHTRFALESLGFGTAPCIIHPSIPEDLRARLFVDRNDSRKNVDARDKWRADVVAGEEVAVNCTLIADKHGLALGGHSHAHMIGAVAAIRGIYNRPPGLNNTPPPGPEVLDRTLRLIVTTWSDAHPERTDGSLIQGVAWLLREFWSVVDDAAFARLHNVAGPPAIKGEMKMNGGSGRGRDCARVIARHYNHLSSPPAPERLPLERIA